MGKEEMKNKISMALKGPVLQIGFEIICKNLSELEKENATLKELCIQRKKKNAELKEQIEELEKRLEMSNKVYNDNLDYSHHIEELCIQRKKENDELKDKLNNLSSVAEVRLANWQKYEKENKELKELCILRKKRIEDLEEQIKQMKCCGNCGKWENCEKDEMFSQDICGDWELER